MTMLHLHHADELSPLIDALADVLRIAPTDAFTPDVVVIPTMGLRDATMAGLGLRLGASTVGGDGVVANVDWVFTGDFLARALGSGRHGAALDPWNIARLTWAVLEELEHGHVDVPRPNGGSTWALARRIADLFDRYATQRPQLVEAWSRGIPTDGTEEEGARAGFLTPLGDAYRWQYDLWRAVRQRIGVASPPERLPDLLAGLRDGSIEPLLPERVCLFGMGSVPPATLAVLTSLAEVREVHLLLRHHSDAAFRGVKGELAGGLRVRPPEVVVPADVNRLGSSWGRPSLEVAALLDGLPGVERLALSRPIASPTTLLEALQASIRNDVHPAPVDGVLDDGTVRVHACHGDLRQLEVLRDALGHAFVDDPSLQPHEVLVLCPDLSRFAPLIDAVFGRGGLPVPVRVSDRSLTSDQPLVVALQAVVGVASGRASLSEVLAFAELEPVRRRFGWSPADVEQLAGWAATLGARWGLTSDLRAEWGAAADHAADHAEHAADSSEEHAADSSEEHAADWPGFPAALTEGTWQSVARRLLAGIAMQAPVRRAALGGVVPFDDLGADDIRLVGGFADLLERLVRLHGLLEGEKPIADWVDVLLDSLDDFCSVERTDAWQRSQVRRDLQGLVEASKLGDPAADGCAVPLSLVDVRALLQKALGDVAGRIALRSGSVTVTSMIPLHGVPARIVCILGLDSGSIRSGSFDGDDLLGQRPCIGERHPRAESRQLLLDAVLSAGDRLIVTCNGADLTTNKPVFLDVPLIELLGEIGEIVDLDADHVPVVVRHRRHGFHEDALQPDRLVPVGGRPFTFDPAMLEAAEAKREAESARHLELHEDDAPADDGARVAPPSKWSLPSRPLVVDGPVPIERLVDALVNPAKVLLRERLDVRLPGEVEAPDDNFTVEIDPLQKSSLGRDLLEALRRRADYGQWLDAAQLDGTLPPGALGASSLQGVVEEVGHLEASALGWGIDLTSATEERVGFDLPVDEWIGSTSTSHSLRLEGSIGGIVQREGQLLATDIRFARPKPSHRLALVVRLAALQHAQPDVPWTGVLLTRAASSESAKASTTEFGFRFRGDEAARREAALAVLRMAAQMAMWSFRDAVPFLGDTSRSLAERDIDGAYEAFEKVDDAWESLLWAGLSPREMLDAPITRDDPAVIVPYLPSEWADEPDGIALDSRVAATAEWVWRTVNDAIEQIDSSGNPVADAEVPADDVADDSGEDNEE